MRNTSPSIRHRWKRTCRRRPSDNTAPDNRQSTNSTRLEDGVFEDDARELALLKATIVDSSTNEACTCQAQGPHGALAEFDIGNGIAGGLASEFAALPVRLILQHRVDYFIELRRNPRHASVTSRTYCRGVRTQRIERRGATPAAHPHRHHQYVHNGLDQGRSPQSRLRRRLPHAQVCPVQCGESACPRPSRFGARDCQVRCLGRRDHHHQGATRTSHTPPNRIPRLGPLAS